MDRPISTQTLPANYILGGTIDLSKDRRTLLILNIVGLGLFLISAWFFSWLAVTIRPNIADRAFSFSSSSLSGLIWPLVWILAITVGMLVLHEAVHGILFWIFTANRPRFGFRGYYAFAAAPEWYIVRRFYLIVALAPAVLITMFGIAAIFLVTEDMLLGLLFLMTANFSGSVGDMMVAFWLVRKPNETLVQDSGDSVRFFLPA
jgi:hypothetical protein